MKAFVRYPHGYLKAVSKCLVIYKIMTKICTFITR